MIGGFSFYLFIRRWVSCFVPDRPFDLLVLEDASETHFLTGLTQKHKYRKSFLLPKLLGKSLCYKSVLNFFCYNKLSKLLLERKFYETPFLGMIHWQWFCRAQLSQAVLQTLSKCRIIAIQETKLSATGPTKKHLEILINLFKLKNTWRSSQGKAGSQRAMQEFMFLCKELTPTFQKSVLHQPWMWRTHHYAGIWRLLRHSGLHLMRRWHSNAWMTVKSGMPNTLSLGNTRSSLLSLQCGHKIDLANQLATPFTRIYLRWRALATGKALPTLAIYTAISNNIAGTGAGNNQT